MLQHISSRLCLLFVLLFFCVVCVCAQDTVTGAFEGTVTNSETGEPVAGAEVEIFNEETRLFIVKRTGAQGRFFQGLLAPGIYRIRVQATGFQTREVQQRLFIARTGEVVPVPVSLEPMAKAAAAPGKTSHPGPPPPVKLTAQDTGVRAATNARDASNSGSFPDGAVDKLPLGGATVTRSFDELALLLPGVAPPPPTLGNGAGPGQGAGVGSAGQFAVNGLRSRGNNFTVDGSDNNDEDIGVRRQGFVALTPQPVESIREYQAITALAPAKFGRNFGAQVNAVSRSGGNQFHGGVYGFFNSEKLNARNFFDSANGNGLTPVNAVAGRNLVLDGNTFNFVALDGRPVTSRNGSGGEDSSTFTQGGFTFGGPVRKGDTFFFVSGERSILNAVKEASFAVPVLPERGVFHSGTTGLFANAPANRPAFAFPTSAQADALFSLFPFANNPNGVFGPNTFTQTLPASARGTIFSAKIDRQFAVGAHRQTFAGRYNFTDDRRILPVTGGAIFSSLQPRVRTNNVSLFLNSELSGPQAATQIFHQLRASYGRTRLAFDEVRDQSFLTASSRFPNEKFLLNAPHMANRTLPFLDFSNPDNCPTSTGAIFNACIRPNPGPAVFQQTNLTAEDLLGPVGQVKIAGYSPVGVDVFNFPQARVNNTYQLADELTVRRGAHTLAFGADTRRSELNSNLPRNSRPLITFQGAPDVRLNAQGALEFQGGFVRPTDLAAASAATGFFQTLTNGNDAVLNLRYYQLNFFAQDNWRVRQNLSLSFGLRYEYNTPVTENARRVERSFNDPALSLVPDLNAFIGGRTRAYEPDRNNFAPRVAIAYSPDKARRTVIRAGYGLFYDQILGAVVSQSRNVFPRFLNVNTAGGGGSVFIGQPLNLLNPSGNPVLVQPGTLNTLNPNVPLATQIEQLNLIARAGGVLPAASGIEATLPARQLESPQAQQFTVGVEREFNANFAVSAAYVGTRGEKLLRFATPNLGSNAVLFLVGFGSTIDDVPGRFQPSFFGFAVPPGSRLTDDPARPLAGGRPVPGVGGVSVFETTGHSRYDSLQLQARGRFFRALQFQTAYTLSQTLDDVSDVFDLAGASALPQNSLTRAGERAYANFDARHRAAWQFIYEAPDFDQQFLEAVLGGLQITGTGQYQTGAPFTVNSLFDINLDGNLTDRLNRMDGLVVTGDRRQPLRLTVDPRTLVAPIGGDGAVGRNAFRAGSLFTFDASVGKPIKFTESRVLLVRVEIFNVFNRANFGAPVRFLEAPGFGQATDTLTPGRRVQFTLKFMF
jgi:hypothetical protein